MGLRSFAIHAKVDSRAKLLSDERFAAEVYPKNLIHFKFVHSNFDKEFRPKFRTNEQS